MKSSTRWAAIRTRSIDSATGTCKPTAGLSNTRKGQDHRATPLGEMEMRRPKARMKVARYTANGKVHTIGIGVRFTEMCAVTPSIKPEGTKAAASQKRRVLKSGAGVVRVSVNAPEPIPLRNRTKHNVA